jgi:hypothetical protein
MRRIDHDVQQHFIGDDDLGIKFGRSWITNERRLVKPPLCLFAGEHEAQRRNGNFPRQIRHSRALSGILKADASPSLQSK